jgi:signal transduction histidine kinase
MSRAEFARYDTDPLAKPAAVKPVPAAVAPPHQTIPTAPVSSNSALRILLVGNDSETVARVRTLLDAEFGDSCFCQQVSGTAHPLALMQAGGHDVYLVVEPAGAGDTADLIRSATNAGLSAPVLVLSAHADTESDLTVIGSGAADCMPLNALTAGTLARSIRHALLRQQGIAGMQREIGALTTEKTRLNLLREANHRFVENACHDFRSPLTVIKEFASIIAEGLSGDVTEEQAEFLQIILTRVDHLSGMVDGILDASRLESDVIGVRREEQQVSKLIDHARATLEQRALAHKATIEYDIPASLPNVFADAESIGRVIVNLGTNAAKYAGENGRVKLWARYSSEHCNVTIGVTDNGPGIAPEHVKLIFDRFQQLPQDKAAGKDGFGLGLHIASELVRVNFGTLSVESEPQKGSTFSFTLPIFDVNALIPLHFSFLRTSRHSFQKVSIALGSVAPGATGPEITEIERNLTRQLRSYDLVLRLRVGSWLVCAAGDENDLKKITDRIFSNFAEINRNRPEGKLPDLGMREVGTWVLSGQPDGLTDAIRGAYALSPEGSEVH